MTKLKQLSSVLTQNFKYIRRVYIVSCQIHALFDNGKLHNRSGFYISEIASVHKYQRGLLLCKNIIYEERKRVWVHSL